MLTPPHSNTDTPGTVTGTCLPVAEHCSRARASVVLLRAMDNALRHSLWSVFFSGYAFGYGPKTTGATLQTVSG